MQLQIVIDHIRAQIKIIVFEANGDYKKTTVSFQKM